MARPGGRALFGGAEHFPDLGGRLGINPRRIPELCLGRFCDLFQAAEFLQQTIPTDFPDAYNLVEA